MEKMLESLENLLDEVGENEYEVDYGVCDRAPHDTAGIRSPDRATL